MYSKKINFSEIDKNEGFEPKSLVYDYKNFIQNNLNLLLIKPELFDNKNNTFKNLKFNDIRLILENKNISDDDKLKIIKLLKDNNDYLEIINFIEKNDYKMEEIPYYLIQSINGPLKLNKEIYDFILNKNILAFVKKSLILKLEGNLKLSDNYLGEILFSESLDDYSKMKFIKKIGGDFELENNDIYNFFTNKKNSNRIKNFLVGKIKYSNIKIFRNFLKEKNIDASIKERAYFINPNFLNIYNYPIKSQKKIIKNMENFLFSIESNGSKIFDSLINKMKNKPKKYIENIIINDTLDTFKKIIKGKKQYSLNDIKNNGKKISEIQEKELSDNNRKISKKLGLDSQKLELSLYIRMRNINYPEIMYYIIEFLKLCVKNNYFKYFSGIRIIPRHIDEFPDDFVFNDNIVQKFNVENEEFKNALETFAVAYSFNHGTNPINNSIPNIGPKNIKGLRNIDVCSRIDLKDGGFIEKCSLVELFEEIYNNIKEEENELDKLVKKY